MSVVLLYNFVFLLWVILLIRVYFVRCY